MGQHAESYRITIRFPWIDAIWMKRLGDAQIWEERDPLAMPPELHQFCLRKAYQLNFDTGCLLCVTREEGRYTLTHAIPVTIASLTRPTPPPGGLNFGADPEFILSRFQHPLIAAHYVPRHNWIGTDTLRISADKQIPALVELRPNAQRHPHGLLKELAQLIHLLDDYIVDDSIHFIAGSMPFPGVALGGHVHVSGIWPEVDLIRVLDNYLALPLALCEWADQPKSRRPRYGQLGDVRFQSHGGFEYRTCPSWLEHPDYAAGVLELVAFYCENYSLFQYRWLSDPRIVQAFYQADEACLAPIAQLIWEELWHWRNRVSNFEAVESLFQRLLAHTKWSRTDDFRINWREIDKKML
jgi:hypothetical protein